MFVLFGVVMVRLVIIGVLVILFSVSWDGVQADKKDARESMTPTEPYHLYMPSPFKKNYEGQDSHHRH